MDEPVTTERSEAEHLAAYLAEFDPPCPVCQYNLRGLTTPKCPECGAQLDLRIGSVDLRIGPWVTVVVFLSVPCGVAATALIIVCLATMTWGYSSAAMPFVLVDTGALVVSSIWLIVLLRRRKWFLKRPRHNQVLMVRLAISYAVVSIGTLVWYIMKS